MKFAIGVIGVIAGVALGLYVGVWVMFVGGIVGVVGFIQGMIEGNADGMLLAISILKVVFASFVGVVSAYVLVIPSLALMRVNNFKFSINKRK